MRTLLALCIALGLCEPAQAQQAGNPCAKYAELTRHLAQRYGEQVIWRGVADDGGSVIEIFAANGQTFSVVRRLPNGMACLMATGNSYDAIVAEVGGRGA